jgi:hypothetical protein
MPSGGLRGRARRCWRSGEAKCLMTSVEADQLRLVEGVVVCKDNRVFTTTR